MPTSGNDSRCALHELTSRPATWFEFVDDADVIAFKQPLLTALAQSVAVGELVSGPRAGTLVVIPAQPPEGYREPRFVPAQTANAFAVD